MGASKGILRTNLATNCSPFYSLHYLYSLVPHIQPGEKWGQNELNQIRTPLGSGRQRGHSGRGGQVQPRGAEKERPMPQKHAPPPSYCVRLASSRNGKTAWAGAILRKSAIRGGNSNVCRNNLREENDFLRWVGRGEVVPTRSTGSGGDRRAYRVWQPHRNGGSGAADGGGGGEGVREGDRSDNRGRGIANCGAANWKEDGKRNEWSHPDPVDRWLYDNNLNHRRNPKPDPGSAGLGESE